MIDARDVLSDLFEELLVANSKELADAVIRRLADAGFRIVAGQQLTATGLLPELLPNSLGRNEIGRLQTVPPLFIFTMI